MQGFRAIQLPEALYITCQQKVVPRQLGGKQYFCLGVIRLVRRQGGKGRVPAVEIMLNSPLIADLIFKGEVAQIKEIMAKSTQHGMQTFDQSLFDLYEKGLIAYEDAIRNADSQNELRLRIKLEGKRDQRAVGEGIEDLRIVDSGQGKRF